MSPGFCENNDFDRATVSQSTKSSSFFSEKVARSQTEHLQNLLLCVSGHGEKSNKEKKLHQACAMTVISIYTGGMTETALDTMILAYSTANKTQNRVYSKSGSFFIMIFIISLQILSLVFPLTINGEPLFKYGFAIVGILTCFISG